MPQRSLGLLFAVAACGHNAVTPDAPIDTAPDVMIDANLGVVQQDYLKASNTATGGRQGSFGAGIALSSDGSTLAIGAVTEASAGTGIDGNQTDSSAPYAGAVYVFTRSGATWTQQAYVKASNTSANS